MNNYEGGTLDGGRELQAVQMRDEMAGTLFGKIVDAVNSLARNAGVTVLGNTPAPPKVDSIQIKGSLDAKTNILTCPGESLHFTITHNQSVSKGIHYFSDLATDSNFTQPHTIDHGTSRSAFLTIPTFLDDGSTPQTFYLRSYAQYPGSEPCSPTVLGNFDRATLIKMSGTTASTLLPSTGSGTASPTGQQGGKGFGTVVRRPAPTSKRSIRKFGH